VFPARLTAEQRKLLLKAASALQADVDATMPELADWQKRHGLR